MPWKNGGGLTWEIAAFPADAGFDHFAWRVSVAEVQRDGPFSSFPGVDRTLVLLRGEGMRLSGEGNPVELRVPYEPIRFSGEAPLDCELLGGATRDFNVMVRRAYGAAEVRVVREEGEVLAPASAYLCYSAAGACECLIAGLPPIEVATEHALVVQGDCQGLHVNPRSRDTVALVTVIEAAA